MASRRHLEYGLGESVRKKDDDSNGVDRASQMLWYIRNVRRRRIVLAALALWLVYLFYKNIPTDVLPVGQRVDSRYGRLGLPVFEDSKSQHSPDSDHDGPVRFFDLAETLHQAASEPLYRASVLFAFAHPWASSNVVTAACTMASYGRTTVHVALMGREVTTLADVLKVNGILLADCPVRWHNAQVDFAPQSGVSRLAKGVQGAFGHIHHIIQLSAVFYDASDHEFDYLRKSVVLSARSYGVAAIPVPKRDAWMLALDGPSLSEWPNTQIDILIHAQSESAGALLRLLRSLSTADYGGLPYPRITVELPPRTDAAIFNRLAGFVWPPKSLPANSKLVLRHRVDDAKVNPAKASVQMVESFYPKTSSSHVLVLSPDVEMSSKFYQPLMYLILEYRHSQRMRLIRDGMVGISLIGQPGRAEDTARIEMSQRISAKAELFFGDRWAEMHQFLSMRLAADPKLSLRMETHDQTMPTWARLTTELMKSQGYSVLQAGPVPGASALAVVHTDLPASLDEALESDTTVSDDLDLLIDGQELSAQRRLDRGAKIQQMSASSLLSLVDMGVNGSTESIIGNDKVVFFGEDDEPVDRAAIFEQAKAYARRFALAIGGCIDVENVQPGTLESLFC